MALRDGDRDVRKPLSQPVAEHWAHYVLRGEVSCVYQVQSQCPSFKELVVLHIRGDKSVASLG